MVVAASGKKKHIHTLLEVRFLKKERVLVKTLNEREQSEQRKDARTKSMRYV